MIIRIFPDSKSAVSTAESPSVAKIRLCPILIVLIAALLSSGCVTIFNSDTDEPPPTAEELFARAERQFEDGDYFEAVKSYERIISGHPEFEKIPVAHLRIGDALFMSEEYDKAAADYHRFVTLFPNNPNVPRAKYMSGMCSYMQRMSVDKDDTALRHATKRFKQVMDEYKGTKWGDKAEQKYIECRKDLAAKELYKARTYITLKKYKAARIAARRVLEQYGNLGYDEEAKEIIEDVKDR